MTQVLAPTAPAETEPLTDTRSRAAALRPRAAGVAAVDRAVALNLRLAPTLVRLGLAAVFVWFGALKVAGISPVHDLIAATLPWFDPGIVVPALGGVELAIGLALAVGRLPRITLLVLCGHLVGTFLTFVTATSWVIHDGNPLRLTADGEFVLKNIVLISAALLLVGWHSLRSRTRIAD